MDKLKPIPYGRQSIDKADIEMVSNVLKTDWLTTGPMVKQFEDAVATYCRSRYAVAVNSGTAALHCAMYAIGIGPGDEVIVPPMTFAATANAVVYQKGTPVFADVYPDTLLINPSEVEKKITPKTRAVVAVDYAGQSCDYDTLRQIADDHQLFLIADACHSIGGSFRDRRVGSCADLNIFSFHPVKHITTGEGGMVTTNDKSLADRMQRFRNHGISRDAAQRQAADSWEYEIEELGFNYRLTDFQCALGLSQLKKLDTWIKKRNEIAKKYTHFFSTRDLVSPLKKHNDIVHAYHLYIVQLDFEKIGKSKPEVFSEFKSLGIHLNVHYIPVHLHPFYRKNFATFKGLCPVSETAYEKILSIPVFPAMSREDIYRVCSAFAGLLPGT